MKDVIFQARKDHMQVLFVFWQRTQVALKRKNLGMRGRGEIRGRMTRVGNLAKLMKDR